MEELTTYVGTIGIFNITLTKTDTELTIEVEKTTNFQFYTAKLTNDVATEITGKLFPTIDAVFYGFIAALDNSEQNTKLTISPDAKLTFTHKTMVGKVEVPITFSIALEEIKDDPSKIQERQIVKLKNKIAELELQLKALKKHDYIHITPVFDSEGTNKAGFNFSNGNKTISRILNSGWLSLFSKEPLPDSGKYQFVVKIEKVGSPHGHIMIGIASGSFKASQYCYSSNGSACFYVHNSSLYYNGGNFTLQGIAASVGDKITVLVDIDQGEIVFKIEDYVAYRRKGDFSSFKNFGLYPCIHSNNPNDSLTFL